MAFIKTLSQPVLFKASLLAVLLFGIKLFFFQKSLLIIWLITLCMGFVLYKSGICFAAMYQNILLFREYSMARAVLLLLTISFIGISFFQSYGMPHGNELAGRFHSFGVHTAVGSFLFGIGMTIAGGCAVGTLQRIGEGFSLFWLVLAGMVIGSTIGIFHYSWWVNNFFTAKPVILSKVFGSATAWVITIAILAGLFLLTFLFEKKAKQEDQKCKKRS